MADRRTPLAPVALNSYKGGGGRILPTGARAFKLSDGSGLYGMDALAEFLQYEIDGSFQTDVNEYMVQPFCLASIQLDSMACLKKGDREKAHAALLAVGTCFGRITRRSDRAAKYGAVLGTLLRRTDPRSVIEFYVPRIKERLSDAAREAGMPTTLSFGIAGHPDAAVRSVEDLISKCLYALEEAKKLGPGCVVAYDLKTMPGTISDKTVEALARQLR